MKRHFVWIGGYHVAIDHIVWIGFKADGEAALEFGSYTKLSDGTLLYDERDADNLAEDVQHAIRTGEDQVES